MHGEGVKDHGYEKTMELFPDRTFLPYGLRKKRNRGSTSEGSTYEWD